MKDFELIPEELPKRGSTDSVYKRVMDAFAGSGEESVRVVVPGLKNNTVYVGLSKEKVEGIKTYRRGENVYLVKE